MLTNGWATCTRKVTSRDAPGFYMHLKSTKEIDSEGLNLIYDSNMIVPHPTRLKRLSVLKVLSSKNP